MADTHCFIGTREVGKTKLRTTASGASNSSQNSVSGGGGRKSPQQRISDILRMRRLRLNRAKTTTASSLSDSLSESANNAMLMRGTANRTNSNSLMSNSSSDLCRNNSGVSHQSARSIRSNMTAMTTLSSASTSSTSKKRSGMCFFFHALHFVCKGYLELPRLILTHL